MLRIVLASSALLLTTARSSTARVVPAAAFLTRSITKCAATSRSLQMTAPEVTISNAFDGGNGVLVKTEEAIENGVTNVEVKIQPDIYTELEKKQHFQHFYFRALVKGCGTVRYSIVNAGEASYAKAWKDSTTFVCTTTPSDAHSWKRVLDTKYEDGHLTWTQTHERSGSAYFAYFAYFPPYSYERHLQFIAKCEASPDCTVESLGQTLDGRELDCISVGSGSSVCWIIHRQHPGESMAEYYAEGLLTRLLGLDRNGAVDGQVRNVLQKYKFYIVPNMCPDGAIRGHLRTNACGANLNREWTSTGNDGDDDYYQAPTLERSPEVYHVLKKMDETSVDAFLDVHGDEALPFNFLAGSEGCTNWSTRLEALHGAFLASYERSNSDMQREISYEPDAPNEGMPNICSNQIALRYDCFSATLEQPFKDCLTNPDPTRGWNPARSAQLGASVVDALAYVHPYLRDETEFWKNLPEEDKYIRPTNKY